MELQVREVMTQSVTTLGPDLSLTEMERVLLAAGISGAPVVERGALVGIVSRSDAIEFLYGEQKRSQKVSGFYTSPFPIALSALEHLARDRRDIAERMTKTRVREIMTPNPRTVSPTDSLSDAARAMWEEHFHRVPVVEQGKVVGILSSLDIARLVAERGVGPP